jgi:hypothetical protein
MQRERESDALPIFRLSRPEVDAFTVGDHARRAMRLDEFDTSETESAMRARSGSMTVDVHKASGGIWAADRSRLWRTSEKYVSPDEAQTTELGSRIAAERELLPRLARPFVLRELAAGRTQTAVIDARGERTDERVLHRSARWAVEVEVPDGPTVPVIGGGGKFGLTIAGDGEVAGFHGVWRPAAGVFEAKAIPRAQLDERFRELTKGLDIQSVESELAYYSAPASVDQEFLYPVRTYRAMARFEEHDVPLRVITLPATEFGPPSLEPIESVKRLPQKRHAVRLPSGGKRSLTTLRWPWLIPFEAGTSWIGESGGLGGSAGNIQGFVDGLRDDGWRINFNWGDANAWESDWRRNDDDWVDAADFVFYTGHANMDGWVLSNPDDGFLAFNEVAGGADLYGQNDLEWVVVAACGPLQDAVISAGGGDVFSRWSSAFDGLHLLLGYGAITFDNSDEGRLLVQYAREGQTLVEAWFRTATEVQPSTNGASPPDGPDVWVGAVWPYKGGVPPVENDHLWGHGSVSPDIDDPDGFVAIWTTT